MLDPDVLSSFVASSMVELCQLIRVPLEKLIAAETLIGTTLIGESVKSFELRIGEVEFPIFALVLEMRDFNLILGIG